MLLARGGGRRRTLITRSATDERRCRGGHARCQFYRHIMCRVRKMVMSPRDDLVSPLVHPHPDAAPHASSRSLRGRLRGTGSSRPRRRVELAHARPSAAVCVHVHGGKQLAEGDAIPVATATGDASGGPHARTNRSPAGRRVPLAPILRTPSRSEVHGVRPRDASEADLYVPSPPWSNLMRLRPRRPSTVPRRRGASCAASRPREEERRVWRQPLLPGGCTAAPPSTASRRLTGRRRRRLQRVERRELRRGASPRAARAGWRSRPRRAGSSPVAAARSRPRSRSPLSLTRAPAGVRSFVLAAGSEGGGL